MGYQKFYASTWHHQRWKGPRRYIIIYLYDTLPEYRAALNKYSQGNDEVSQGCFHPSPIRMKYILDTAKWENRSDPHYAGIMRLCKDHLTYEVITHECIHAAAHIYRMDVRTTVNLGKACHEAEEDFAYLVGALTDRVIKELDTRIE